VGRTTGATITLRTGGGATLAVDGGPIGESDPATVSSFRLDKYLVTVGRFRQFVTAWNRGADWLPTAGSGKHSHVNGGMGLNATGGGYEPGWMASDDANIAPTDASLACEGLLVSDLAAGSQYGTWTPSAGTQENLPEVAFRRAFSASSDQATER
jgi:formylglycine-generating enzyme